MTGPQLVRFSGLTLMVGGAVSVLQILFSSLAYSGNDPTPYVKNPVWAATQLIGVVAVLLVIVGLPGVYASWANRAGMLGLIALLLIGITGLLFPFFFGLVQVMIFPWLVDKAPSLVSGGSNSGPPSLFIFFIGGTVIELVGTALLAILFLRGRLLPRWIGFVLAASAIMAVVGFFLSGPNGPSNVVISLITSLAPLLLLAALSYIGYQTWSASAAPSPATQAEGPVTT
jgi:hypothetical protein